MPLILHDHPGHHGVALLPDLGQMAAQLGRVGERVSEPVRGRQEPTPYIRTALASSTSPEDGAAEAAGDFVMSTMVECELIR
jgi:hypothetical protein